MIIVTVCQFLLVCFSVVDSQSVGKCKRVNIQPNLPNTATKGVAFPRVEFAVINHTLRTRLKFVYCSINEAYGEN